MDMSKDKDLLEVNDADLGDLAPDLAKFAKESADQPQRAGRSFTTNLIGEPAGEPVVEPVPEHRPDEPAPAPTTRMMPVVMPDGNTQEYEVPTDPVEFDKFISSKISGTAAYEKGREIIKEKAPELSNEWRGLLKTVENQGQVQSQILQNMANTQQQVQENQDIDPMKLIDDDQREHYNYLKDDKGDEREAALFLKKEITRNMREHELRQQIEQQKKDGQKQQFLSRVSELRRIDPTLPKPSDTNFQQSFYDGFGGWVLDKGFSEEQIFFDDKFDIEALHKFYLFETGQSQSEKTQKGKNPESKDKASAKAPVMSPEVAQSIRAMSAGSGTAPIGNSDKGAEYRELNDRQDIRKYAEKNPIFNDDVLQGFGLAKFFKKKKKK